MSQEEPYFLVSSMLSEALSCYERGMLKEAIEINELAMEAANELLPVYDELYILTLARMALYKTNNNEFAEAHKYLKLSASLCEIYYECKTDIYHYIVKYYSGLYYLQKRFIKSLKYAEKALETINYNDAEYMLEELTVNSLIANNLMALKKYDKAEKIIMKIYDDAGSTLGKVSKYSAFCLTALSEIYISTGRENYSLDEKAVQLALQYYGEQHIEYAKVLHTASRHMIQADKHNKATTMLSKAMAIYDKNEIKDTYYLGILFDDAMLASKINNVKHVYLNFRETIKTVESIVTKSAIGITEKGKDDVFRICRGYINKFIMLIDFALLSKKEKLQAYEAMYKFKHISLTVAELTKSYGFNKESAVDNFNIDTLIKLSHDLQKAAFYNRQQDYNKYINNINQVQYARDACLILLNSNEEFQAHVNKYLEVKYDDILNRLQPGEIIIDYYIIDEFSAGSYGDRDVDGQNAKYIVFAIGKSVSQGIAIEMLGGVDIIDEVIADLQSALEKMAEKRIIDELLYKLYDKLLEKIFMHLEANKVATIYMCPVGLISLIPINLLIKKTIDKYLLELFEVKIINRPVDILNVRPMDINSSLAVFYDPNLKLIKS